MRNSKTGGAPKKGGPAAGILFTLLSAFGFGITPMIATGVLDAGMNSIALAFWRCALVLPFLFFFVVFSHGATFRLNRTQFLKTLVLSLCGAVLTGILLISSYAHLDTGSATTLNFTYPIFVLLLGGVFFHQRIRGWDVGCFVLCGIGVVLLCGFGGRFSWVGFWQALGSGIIFGIYVLYLDQSHIMDELHIAQYTFYYFLFGAALLLPIALLKGDLLPPIGLSMYGQTALYAVLCGFLCTFLFQLGVERIGSKLASLLSTLEPVITLMIGTFFLNETVTSINWIGAAIILVSAVLLTWRSGDSQEDLNEHH